MFNPQSESEYLHREEQHERRAEALARHRRRQQAELFELFPACPNCGAFAEPVFFDFGRDCASGYDDSGEACVACIKGER